MTSRPSMLTARQSFAVIGTACVLGVLALRSSGDTPATEPAATTAPTAAAVPDASGKSLLEQLSDDTERVYAKARLSMVRVQLPTPEWLDLLNQQKHFIDKWGNRLDPQVLAQLLKQQADMQRRVRNFTTPPAGASTQPGFFRPDGSSDDTTNPGGNDNLVLIATGLLVDHDGHAVFPLFVDRAEIGNTKLPALTGDGQPTTATFVGSDRKTNLTVLQLARHTGELAPLGHARPNDGQLALILSADSSARLVVWTNLHPEPGLAVLPNGTVAGFGIQNTFLAASAAKPIVDQLIAFGEVHRAFLGVHTLDVRIDDPLRQQLSELGNRPAIHVKVVDPDSAAARGGILPEDLILAISDEPVGDLPTFAALIATRSGDTDLTILRDNKIMHITVQLRPN